MTIHWSCATNTNFYLLSCRRGALELFEIIERRRWACAIDRALLFKRAIESLSRSMHSVISSGLE